ncbi:MAG: DUF4124 domain-containing protein [Gammaproteobacteria bacterium]
MNLRMLFGAILASAALLAAAAHADTVYRWVDTQGHVHYSQSPPSGTVASAVKVVPPPAPTSTSAADRQSLDKFLRTQQAAQKKQAAAERAAAKQLAQQQKRCVAARQRLQKFLASHNVLPEADSNAIGDFQNDQQIARQTQLQKQMAAACQST